MKYQLHVSLLFIIIIIMKKTLQANDRLRFCNEK